MNELFVILVLTLTDGTNGAQEMACPDWAQKWHLPFQELPWGGHRLSLGRQREGSR